MNEQKSKDHTQNHPLPDAVIESTKKSIDVIRATRQSNLLVLVSHASLDVSVAMALNGVMRRMGRTDALDVLLDSGGGDLDFAYKMLKMLKSYAERVTVIVPFYAKSAATLIALGADRLQMCRAGELGPIDPQVMDPNSGMMVPALSIKNAMDFIDDAHSPLIKASLADKISPLLMGAYRNAVAMSKQYLDEIFTRKDTPDEVKARLIDMFTEKFRSHGYPMTRDFLLECGVAVDALSETEENWFADLHEKWMTYCGDVYAANREQAGTMLVLQSSEVTFVKLGDNIIQKVGM